MGYNDARGCYRDRSSLAQGFAPLESSSAWIRKLGKPVVTSNQALSWTTLQVLVTQLMSSDN
jgi:hypothetical protein